MYTISLHIYFVSDDGISRMQEEVVSLDQKLDKGGAKRSQKYNFIKSSPEERSSKIIKATKLKKNKYGIKDISISDEMVVDELLIFRPYEKMLKAQVDANASKIAKSWGPLSASPLRYHKNKYENTHFAALDGRPFGRDGLNQKIRYF